MLTVSKICEGRKLYRFITMSCWQGRDESSLEYAPSVAVTWCILRILVPSKPKHSRFFSGLTPPGQSPRRTPQYLKLDAPGIRWISNPLASSPEGYKDMSCPIRAAPFHSQPG
jgi:hypothetical protein